MSAIEHVDDLVALDEDLRRLAVAGQQGVRGAGDGLAHQGEDLDEEPVDGGHRLGHRRDGRVGVEAGCAVARGGRRDERERDRAVAGRLRVGVGSAGRG